MVHREPVAERRAQPLELVGEDHRVGAAVRVHEQDRTRVVVASALLMIEITGVMPLPPANATIGTSRSCSTKSPVGRITSIVAPGASVVVHPVRHAAARHALHRRGERVAGVGRARHRVATARPARRRSSARNVQNCPAAYANVVPRARAGSRGRTTGVSAVSSTTSTTGERRGTRGRSASAIPGRRARAMITRTLVVR